MNDYQFGHHTKKHSDHKGEVPTTGIDVGPAGITVNLDHWGPHEPQAFRNLLVQEQAGWRPGRPPPGPIRIPEMGSVPDGLDEEQQKSLARIFSGKGYPQSLEQFSFSFFVGGVSLNCTHQLVRTRLGAAFLQQSMRNNDGRHMRFTMPETIERGLKAEEYLKGADDPAYGCFDAEKFLTYMGKTSHEFDVDLAGYDSIRQLLETHLLQQKLIYAALLDAGIPFQDARRFLGSGHQTYLYANYNWPGLASTVANRTEHIAMDWEIDCVCQLMMREVWLKCPRFMARALGSHSDKMQREAFAGVSDWPSSGKWPGPKRDHTAIFSPLQCPFWVLSPRSLVTAGQPEWLRTNGKFPWDEWEALAKGFVPDHPWRQRVQP